MVTYYIRPSKSFNHQTVYRLLSSAQLDGLTQRLEFQSPNGVQIAFDHALAIFKLNVPFQSPNGVQIALILCEKDYAVYKFQSPNGVQIEKILIFYIIQHLIDFLNAFI